MSKTSDCITRGNIIREYKNTTNCLRSLYALYVISDYTVTTLYHWLFTIGKKIQIPLKAYYLLSVYPQPYGYWKTGTEYTAIRTPNGAHDLLFSISDILTSLHTLSTDPMIHTIADCYQRKSYIFGHIYHPMSAISQDHAWHMLGHLIAATSRSYQ